MLPIQEPVKIVSLFYCYADQDKLFQEQLRAHLGLLLRQKLLTDWGPGDLRAGQTKEEEINNHLNTAHLILFLVSSDFTNSDDCITIKERALERYQKKEVRILPILVRHADVTDDLFSGIELLRIGNKPVADWGEERDGAYTQIATKIRILVYEILGRKHTSETSSETPPAEQINPYRGLKPYTEQDAPFFFGRNTCIFGLMQKLVEDKRLLVVLGPTGSGKTSILQAGVIPLLREGRTLTRSATWEILLFTPGEHATSQLLSLLGAPDAQDIREGLKIWQQQHPKNERVVIVIDPFEELFKLATPEEQQKFLKQCLKLIIYDLATIIIGMNDAYYGDLAEFADFIALAEPQISNIPALIPEEIRDIIEKPADLASLHFGDHLVERVIDDTMKSSKEPERRHRHSSILPHLSIGLEQLYEKQRDHLVTLDDYLSLGQISGSLTIFANTAFNALDEQQQSLARRILVDLVALGDESEGRPDTRRQRLLTSLCRTQDERKAVQAVVDKLANAHLLEAQWSQQKKDLEVTLINESLLREWGPLKDWLREDRQFLLWYQEFERHLQKWLSSSVLSLCYHQSEDWFITASEDGDVRVYTLSDGVLRQSIPHHTSTLTVAVSSQKPYVATIDDQERVWIWQVHDGTLPVRFPYSGKVAYLAFDQKGGKDLLHFAVKEAALLKMHTLSLDPSLINTAYEFQHAPSWIVSNDKRHFTIPDGTVKIDAVSFDGSYYAAATPDGNIHVIGMKGYYDKNTNHVRGTITALVFSHSGEYLAIVTTEGSLFLWKWREKDLVPMPLPQGASLQAALFSRNDDYLVVVVNKHEVSTWYWQRPAEKPEAIFRQDSPIHTITLCPNTPYLLTTSQEKNVSIWDLSTGLFVQSLSKREVVAAAFATEGNYLAIASSDYTVGIWNVSTGEQLTSLPHTDRVYAIAFSKDRRYLATVCDDAMIRLWLWKQDDLEAEARLRLTSNLTPEEWQEYLKNEPYQETFPNLGWRDLS